MNEDNKNVSLDQGLTDLYIILTDEFEGIIKRLLDTNFSEKYSDKFDLVTALECMEDEVSRVWRLVGWHDKLAEIDTETWKFIESDNPNDLELTFKESAWLLRLKERIEVELMLRKLRNEDSDEDEDDNTVEYDMKKILLEFCDFLLESVPSLDFFDKDNAKRLQLIEDFLEDWSGKNKYEPLMEYYKATEVKEND